MTVMAFLMNLDFAGGDGATDTAVPGGATLRQVYGRQRKKYAYGYRYIVRWPLWT